MRWPGGIRRAIWFDFSLLTGYQVEHNCYANYFWVEVVGRMRVVGFAQGWRG